jgi:hypothetical protein
MVVLFHKGWELPAGSVIMPRLERLSVKNVNKMPVRYAVLVFAPWCGFSKGLRATLAKYRGGTKVFVLYDTDEGVLGPRVGLAASSEGYPQLYLRQGRSRVSYRGDRTLSDLTRFLG